MSNVLKIDGRKSFIINPELNLEIGVFLSAQYQGQSYDLRVINALGVDNKISLAVLRFDPNDRKHIKGGLNHIVLATTFGGNYRATGVSHISDIDKRGTKFYRLGDDLEIIVDRSAEEAIESIKECQREIERTNPGRDIPTDYLGLPFSPN